MNSEFQVSYSDRFFKNFEKIDREAQIVIREAVNMLVTDPRHPSLRTKRVQGTRGVFEASANLDLRITWQYEGDGVLHLRNCGHHDRTLKNP